MHDSRVSRRYAQALFATALKYDVVKSVEGDLNAIGNLLENGKEFRQFFIAPYNSRPEKIAIAERLFADRITALSMQLLRVMLEKGREREILGVREEFAKLRRDHEGILHAVITSATPLDSMQRAALVSKLQSTQGKGFEAEFEVDPRLMGGVKVAFGSFVLDGTVSGGLSKLRDALRHDVLKQA